MSQTGGCHMHFRPPQDQIAMGEATSSVKMEPVTGAIHHSSVSRLHLCSDETTDAVGLQRVPLPRETAVGRKERELTFGLHDHFVDQFVIPHNSHAVG